MPILAYVAVMAHLLVLYRGFLFFRCDQQGRAKDKHLVAAVMAGSALFLASQVTAIMGVYVSNMTYTENPSAAAFAIFNAAFYATLVNELTGARTSRSA